jgi:superfamily II DNA or RNA helicase
MSISSKPGLTLPKLTSIVFYPGPLLSLSGVELQTQDIYLETLPAGTRPEPKDFDPFLVKSGISTHEVPTCFGSSPHQNDLTWRYPPGAKDLADSIQYVFSDGVTIDVSEILYHPYCIRLPSSLLPLSSQIRTRVNQTPWLKMLSKEILSNWSDLRLAEQCLLSILFEAHQIAKRRPEADPLLLWITDQKDPTEKRKACAIKEIDLLQNWQSGWALETSSAHRDEDGQAQISFQEIPAKPGGIILENLELNPQEGTLHFHPYQRTLEVGLKTLFSSEDSLPPSSSIQPLTFPLTGHQSIEKMIDAINEKLTRQGFKTVIVLDHYKIPSSQIKTHVNLEKTGEFYFCRAFEVKNNLFQIWNLPSISDSIIKGLEGGIGATTGTDHRSYAQDRRGQRRDRDLKILKHSGAFALMTLETLSYLFKKKTFEGKPIHRLEDFFQLLFAKLGVLLFDIEKKAGFIDLSPPPPLDKLCSKNVIELIKKTILNWLDQAEQNEERIFTSLGVICLEGGIPSAFQLFYEILARVATNSRGTCFLKIRAGVFANFFHLSHTPALANLCVKINPIAEKSSTFAQAYLPIGQWLSLQQILHTILPLRHHEIQLEYAGLPLNEMSIDDFRPEFNLVEHQEPSAEDQSIDWFELHPKFFFKGVEIGAQNLERLSREGVLEFQGKVYLIQNKNLPSVRRLEAFWAKIQGSQPAQTKRKTNETFLLLPKNQTLEMLALRASGVQVHGEKRWQEICQFYDTLGQAREPVQIPSSLHAELKPYQKSGVRWLLDLYHLGLGGVLADDMGLGKTIQILAFLECLRTEDKMGRVLIVVPTSLTYNWISESNRFTPDLPIQIFQSKSKDDFLDYSQKNKNFAVVCTYGLFTEHQEFFETQKWNALVFDEAQNLKNISAKRTTASRKIAARFKVCLTGTPLENHLGEFYSLLDLTVSGSLGDLSEFRQKFVNVDYLDPADIKYLRLKAKPLVLRRTKAEILKELPPKIESTIKLPFEKKQEKIYRDIALSWNEKVKDAILNQGEARSQILMLTALLRLRQACSDPGSIPNVKYAEQPPKITVLLEALQEITASGESALVFTQFIRTFDRIKAEMTRQKIQNYSLHGGTSRPERERILKEFQEFKKGSVLLMTLKTGGVGLNLVKASYVFHLEPWWNPAVENQATDRAHRIGQQRPVQVYRYLMKESVEEKIEILKERKSARFNAIFSATENEIGIETSDARLTQSDFEYLLG